MKFWMFVVGVLLCAPLSQTDRLLAAGSDPQTADGRTFDRLDGGRRLALVVGSNSYPAKPLRNAVNDARAVTQGLEEVGFTVTRIENASRRQLIAALEEFAGSLGADDVALFYFAGHGVQVESENYLIPTDFEGRTEVGVRLAGLPVSDVVAALRRARVAMAVLDACRDNPYRGGRGGSGLAAMEVRGTLIAYAAGAGQTASDNPGGENGLFTQHFVAALRDQGLTASELFRQVRRRVVAASNERQWPAVYDDLLDDFVFREAPPDPGPIHRRAGAVFHDCRSCPKMVVIPARTFEMGSPASEEGRYDNEGPQHSVEVSSFALGRYEVTRDEYRAFVEATGHPSSGCWILNEGGWTNDDDASWREPGFAQGSRHPAVCVNWNDARAYVRWLSRETGESYRLPSEAEWEYAARGGTTRSRYGGDSSSSQCRYANGADAAAKRVYSNWTVAACDDRAVRTAPVGSYSANGFGLFDVLGNVWEWTEDCWHGNYTGAPRDGTAWTSGGDCSRRVLRGGSWHFGPRLLRSAARYWGAAGTRSDVACFRVARTLD